MIRKAIRYTPKAVVVFSRSELRLMLKASAAHYDGVCKDASAERLSYEGNRPGFLRGMYNYAMNTPPSRKAEQELTFRELDTLAKILEQGHFHVDTDTGRSRLSRLRDGISKALRSLNEHALDDKKL